MFSVWRRHVPRTVSGGGPWSPMSPCPLKCLWSLIHWIRDAGWSSPPLRLCQIRGQSKLARDVIYWVRKARLGTAGMLGRKSRRMAPLEVALKGRKPQFWGLIWHKSFLLNWPPDPSPGSVWRCRGTLREVPDAVKHALASRRKKSEHLA